MIIPLHPSPEQLKRAGSRTGLGALGTCRLGILPQAQTLEVGLELGLAPLLDAGLDLDGGGALLIIKGQ